MPKPSVKADFAGEHLLPAYLKPHWARYQSCYQHHHMPKALLLIYPDGEAEKTLISLMQARFFCTETDAPCGVCRPCRLVQTHSHPDLYTIQSAETGESIKVETIRLLQESLYLPPQIATRRLVYFDNLALLTPAAANALLKVLEEPPRSLYFIGLTQQISLILPTLLSRFQQWILPSRLARSERYLDESRWGSQPEAYLTLLRQAPELFSDLTSCMTGKLSVVTLAEQWSAYPLKTLFQVLYCVIAEKIRITPTYASVASKNFLILNKIESALLQLQRSPSLNPLLMLEGWLLDVVEKQ